MNVDEIRDDFPFLKRRIKDKPILYFDNAATTQKPRQVIDGLTDYYENYCANIHRGVHTLSQESSELYEEARRKVARFINADEREIIFVRNSTEAINLVSGSLKGDGKILTTVAEHHSNMLPWGRARKTEFVDIDNEGKIDLGDLRKKIDRSTLLVAVTHISNVLGLVNPVQDVIEEAKRHGALCLIDGAQSVPHIPIDVKELGCDFLVFSGHKMLGPSGIGVLYVKEEHYDRMSQYLMGGSTIKEVHLTGFVPEDAPMCYEAGTPNIEGAIALGYAIDYLEDVGMENVQAHDRRLIAHALERMREISNVNIYGSTNEKDRLSVITFNVKDVGCHAVAKVLSLRENIMIRSGFHCAQPLHDRLGVGPTARLSFYLYNTTDEIGKAVELLGKVAQFI
ncbi:putative cysteine desulfurase [Candidatus Sulfobium mesophilum]|uniref:Cysteine desulfurase n=1 Tax=Candidatus Sulfobium mesophilum TaxID=2016548 RepID=A0A2U3QDV7_9BACT|nr:putative cysteine desulfurase [Candidatus Sulfobium mesophilum]